MGATAIISTIIGIISGLLIGICAYPLLIKTVKDNNTTRVSYTLFSILAIGAFCFLVNAILLIVIEATKSGESPSDKITIIVAQVGVIIAEVCSLVSAIWLLVLKTINVMQAKKHNMTEKEWCVKKGKK